MAKGKFPGTAAGIHVNGGFVGFAPVAERFMDRDAPGRSIPSTVAFERGSAAVVVRTMKQQGAPSHPTLHPTARARPGFRKFRIAGRTGAPPAAALPPHPPFGHALRQTCHIPSPGQHLPADDSAANSSGKDFRLPFRASAPRRTGKGGSVDFILRRGYAPCAARRKGKSLPGNRRASPYSVRRRAAFQAQPPGDRLPHDRAPRDRAAPAPAVNDPAGQAPPHALSAATTGETNG